MSGTHPRLSRLSPAKLALLLRALQEDAGRGAAALDRPLCRDAGSPPAPLSFAQRRFWFLDQLEPGSPLYNLPVALRVSGPLDAAALAASLGAAIRRHAVLRTRFEAAQGEAVQIVGAPCDRPLATLDLTALPGDRREDEVSSLAAREALRPFDLGRGPLLRASLLRLGSGDHVLLLTLHHAAADGWSMELLLREIAVAYRAWSRGEAPLLPALPIQYADFAAWERQRLAGERLANLVAYWRRQLAGLAPLDLPLDRPRPAALSARGARRFAHLPRQVVGSLEQLGRQHGATLFGGLLAGFAALLHRLTGAGDAAVGSPFAGRELPEVQDLIGCFVNTLLLRLRVAAAGTFRALLEQARDTLMAATAHQDLPFDKLVEELDPERGLGRSPLLQVMLALQNVPVQTFDLPGLRMSPLAASSALTVCDLTLVLVAGGEGRLRCGLEYRSELFDAATAERLLAGFGRLLEAACAAPDLPLQELQLLAPWERQALLVEWNDTSGAGRRPAGGLPAVCAAGPAACAAGPAAGGPPAAAGLYAPGWTPAESAAGRVAATLPDLMRAQAARRAAAVAAGAGAGSGAPAAVCGAESLSYGDLVARSERLALRLRELGVGPEVRVAVCAERSLALAVGVLGVLEAGGACVPLDPAHPRQRLERLLSDSGARVVVAGGGWRVAERLAGWDGEVVWVERLWQAAADGATADGAAAAGATAAGAVAAGAGAAGAAPSRLSPAAPAPRPLPENAAYVFYTSGSTGRPKGVVVPHGALAGYAVEAVRALRLRATDRVLQFAGLSFDVVVEELFPTWASGGTVVFSGSGGGEGGEGGDARLSPRELAAAVERFGVTWMELPTAYWHELVRELAEDGLRLPPSLRLVVVGGEAISGSRLRQWERLAGRGVELAHVFGLTETAVTSAVYGLAAGEVAPACRSQLPVGRPLGDTRLYLLGEQGEPVPMGAAGELYVGGRGVSRGYLGEAARTAERFVPDGFGGTWGERGGRLYRTGDVARYRADGSLEFLGRVDQQVKVRGHRVEPGEIEAELERCPGIAASVVRLVGAERGEGRLVAYVVSGPEARREPRAPAVSGFGQVPSVELWPSQGDYHVYDEVLYHAMTSDEVRNAAYRKAIAQVVPGRVVVDVGTGGDVALSRLCVEAGARRVYAIERLEASYRQAQATVKRLGLEERITLVQGSSFAVTLPEPADVCVSELIGCIGGSEGAVAILNDAWRFLRPGGVMIPWRCATRIALVTLPPELLAKPAFTAVSGHYVERIFAEAGRRFDLRLCLRNVPASALLSSAELFEDLEFTAPLPLSTRREVELQVTAAGVAQGMLLWVNLYTVGAELVDVLAYQGCWSPVFFPVFAPGLPVAAGDVVRVECEVLCAAGAHQPDYRVRGELRRGGAVVQGFDYLAPWAETAWRANAFHAALFAGDGVPVRTAGAAAPAAGAADVAAAGAFDGPAAARLRALLAGRLPEHMVPSAFVELPALPLTANGKIDRAALPLPAEIAGTSAGGAGGAGAAGVATAALRTPVEEILAGIWSEVLGGAAVGAHDNFFALGGHSLLAMRVVARARAAFGIELPLRELFEAPTVAGLAARVEAALAAGTGTALPAIARVPRDRPLPLSFAQERLWFLDRLEPGLAAFNVPLALRLRGSLDLAALHGSLAAVIGRHEILRTAFAENPAAAGEGAQRIAPPAPLPLPLIDLASLPPAAAEREARRQAAADARRPFDLARAPLLRAAVLRLAATEHHLLLTLHHIVTDGASVDVLTREVEALYRAALAGRPSPLPPLPVQYADHASWQRRRLRGEVLDGLLAYWRRQLAGSPPLLELPYDRPRPAVRSWRGGGLRWTLPAELSSALAALALRHEATLFMVLLAAFQALLARYSSRHDVCVGMPVAGRDQVATEGLIGLFINTLALRTDTSGEPGFATLLRRVREVVLEAHRHGELPFEKLVAELRPERSLSYTPIYQVLFELEQAAAGAPALPGLAVEPLAAPTGTAKLDLTLAAMAGGRNLAGSLTYSADLFDAVTVKRLLDHFQTLLAVVVRDAATPVAQLPLLAAAERQLLLVEWRGGAAPAAAGGLMHELFESRARQAPDAVALIHGRQRLSYGELDRRADRLARRLAARGVGPEALVALMIGRSPEMVVAILAVLKAGGAYVPLDLESPRERLARLLAAVRPAQILTQRRLLPRLPSAPAVVCLDDGEDAAAPRPGEDGPPLTSEAAVHGAGSLNLAYVVHTSGSTGSPKGILGTHGGACSYLRQVLAVYGLHASDVALQLAAPSFDGSVRDIFGPLSAGASLVLLPEEEVRDPRELLAAIRIHGVTCLPAVVPTMLGGLLDAAAGEPGIAGVRLLLASGESLRLAEHRRARAFFGPRLEVINQYGASECAMSQTYQRVVEEPARRDVADAGRPMPNARVFLAEAGGGAAPLGAAGEVLIGVPSLVRGYLGRPDLTAARFVPDPWSGEPGARLYRTGDLGRYRWDGRLEVLGRIDHQVKVRGMRVELDEVAAALGEHPAVRQAVVVARGRAAGASVEGLVAYVVPDPLQEPPAHPALRAFLRQRLPEAMVPAVYVSLAALPRTLTGKVDRQALPAPAGGRPALEQDFVAPRDDSEEQVAAIWAEVLRLDRVGVRDDFFDLGGHSLAAMQVAARVRQRLGVEMPLRLIFEQPTVEGLAARLAAPPARRRDEIAAIATKLDMLERLSEAEVVELLRGRRAGARG
jgi:amino acid adenylation domain-containing protein